jgi:hypothetical protein
VLHRALLKLDNGEPADPTVFVTRPPRRGSPVTALPPATVAAGASSRFDAVSAHLAEQDFVATWIVEPLD